MFIVEWFTADGIHDFTFTNRWSTVDRMTSEWMTFKDKSGAQKFCGFRVIKLEVVCRSGSEKGQSLALDTWDFYVKER